MHEAPVFFRLGFGFRRRHGGFWREKYSRSGSLIEAALNLMSLYIS